MTNDDGVALTSVSHPTERNWAKRLWDWLHRRDLNPKALETVEIEIPEQTHLHWPISDDSLLYGGTEFERSAEEMRSYAYLTSHMRDGTRMLWRRPPKWVEERDYERARLQSYLTWRVTLIHP